MRRLHTILFLMLLSAADGLAHSWIYNNIVGSSQHRSNSSAPMDNLAYTYDGNRISSVNGQTYGHDANGNVTIDSSHGTQVSYNLLNLPRRVEDLQSGDGLNYAYLADGTKAAMTDDDGTGYAYAGDMVFARSPQGTYSFESVAYGNGRIEGASNTVRRYVTDHLGNVRAIVTGNSVVERNDYYPFGGRHPRNTLPVLSANRWRLGAKESQPSLTGSLVDFGARMYDPHTGRWTTQDPMAWKYLVLSPYNYCGNNPVNLVDPDGRRIYYSSGASDDFKKAFSKTIEYMNKQGTANNLYLLEISPVVYYIDEAHSINDVHFDIRRRTIYWDYSHLAETDINMWLSPATTLDHEAAHAVLFDLCVRGIVNKKDYFESAKTYSDKNYGTTEERQAVTKYEQSTARKHGEINETQVTRNNHGIRQVNGSVANKSPQEIQKIIHEHNSLL